MLFQRPISGALLKVASAVAAVATASNLDRKPEIRNDSRFDSLLDFINALADHSIQWKQAVIPLWTRKLQSIFDFDDPGSVGYEMLQDALNDELNPELRRTSAHVRLGNALSTEERAFRHERAQLTKRALASYLGLSENSIDERDVPVIAITGSGGGYRALIATAGYVGMAQKTGLFNCVTYVAGVSGSTWLWTLFYTLGQGSISSVLDHIRSRASVHIASVPDFMRLITTSPTNKYILQGIVEKMRFGTGVELADIYGTLLTSRLLVPADELLVNRDNLKLSHQRRIVDTGALPLPIYTAVRHEMGLSESEQLAAESKAGDSPATEVEERAQRFASLEPSRSWFQWFEFTPYEVGCEELGAWIPTWALGRKFRAGVSQPPVIPELSLGLMIGTFGSAFCATLNHYYQEIKPMLIEYAFAKSLDYLVQQKQSDLKSVHPIAPARIPNFVLGLRPYLPPTCPPSLFVAKDIGLMDAGMDNNLALYPLLRPERAVDMIIAIDCSADIHTVPWLQLVAGYTEKRGIVGWPDTKTRFTNLEPVMISTGKIGKETSNPSIESKETQHVTTPADLDVISSDKAGITLVYCPLISNDKCPGVDPDKSPYMSTWNFIYTPDQVNAVAGLAEQNFLDGSERLKETVRKIYERKKRMRLHMEHTEHEIWRNSILHSKIRPSSSKDRID
ncbi:acyl transferase/acyl hydrolase/lysophospholipase [Dipodascopsis uninucleata]